MSMTWNWVRECNGQLDNWEDRVEISEVGWQGQAVDSVSDTGFDYEWAKSLMGQFG
jgi:hypothetical protein